MLPGLGDTRLPALDDVGYVFIAVGIGAYAAGRQKARQMREMACDTSTVVSSACTASIKRQSATAVNATTSAALTS